MDVAQAKRVTEAKAVRATARAPRWVMPLLKSLLVLTDSVVAIASFVFAFAIREDSAVWVETATGFGWSARFAPYAALLPFILIIRLCSLLYCDLYRLRG